MCILFSYSTKLFSFNNIYSTSIAIFILLNKINCSNSVQTFYSTKIIIQLLPCTFMTKCLKVPGHSNNCYSTNSSSHPQLNTLYNGHCSPIITLMNRAGIGRQRRA